MSFLSIFNVTKIHIPAKKVAIKLQLYNMLCTRKTLNYSYSMYNITLLSARVTVHVRLALFNIVRGSYQSEQA